MSSKLSGSVNCNFAINKNLTDEKNLEAAISLARQIAAVQQRYGYRADSSGQIAHVRVPVANGFLIVTEQSNKKKIYRQYRKRQSFIAA